MKKSLQIISGFTFTAQEKVRAQQAQSNYSPLPYSEWAVLHSTAPIIHQAAEKTIHIHQFSPRELWSRWYKRLYGSDHISHSGLINSGMQSQMLLAGPHMFQLPPRGQKEVIIASNTILNVCICTCFTHLWLGHWKCTLKRKYLIMLYYTSCNNNNNNKTVGFKFQILFFIFSICIYISLFYCFPFRVKL